MIRRKSTKSGKLLEIDFYPVFDDGRRIPTRAPKTKKSTKEQAEYNKRQAEKKLIRLINTNFDDGDIIMHPTYSPDQAPQSEQDARKDIVNYLRRIKNRRRAELNAVIAELNELPDVPALERRRAELKNKKSKLESPLKYIYVIEKVTYKSGKNAGKDNWHFHMFITGGLDRCEYEKMWTKGMRTNADIFQPYRYGFEAIAKYMVKDPQGKKRFCYSRNLKKPTVVQKDNTVTRRGIERSAKNRSTDSEYWEKKYLGYKFVRCYARYNDYNGYWYMSVVMYKSDNDVPAWDVGDTIYF